MKILMIASTPFFSDRGTHIRILEEAVSLEKLGHKITIATYHIGGEIEAKVKTKIDVRRIRRLLFWYKKLEAGPDWQKIILDLMLLRKVFFLARTQRPNIIHGHLHEGVLIGWIVKNILFWRKMKLVADFHGSLTKEMVSHGYLGAGMLKKIFSRIEKIINNLGDYAISSSGENTAEIKKVRRDGKIETVLDGVNLDYYKNLSTKEISKKELRLPLDKTIVVYTGALVPNKGTDYLAEAIPLAFQKNKNLYFVIAGFPMEGMRDFVAKNNLEKQVRLINPLSYFALPEILNASDIAIDPKDSAVNQASGKILQYMGAGLPVVCFDKSNNHEYLSEGACYVKNFSAKGLSDAIVDLSEDYDNIKKIGKYNKERAKYFSWEKSAKQLDKIYKRIGESDLKAVS